MNQRALTLGKSLRGQLADLGSDVRSVCADAFLARLFVRIGAPTDETLRRGAGEPMAIDPLASGPLFKAGAKVSAGIDTACSGKGT